MKLCGIGSLQLGEGVSGPELNGNLLITETKHGPVGFR
jgi:hypothetical protein